MFSTGFTSVSVLLHFPLLVAFLLFCAQFLILFRITQMRFSRSTQLLMFLSLEILTSIIRTGLPILVELIDLVSYVIICLSQTTLLRWLTFLVGSQAVILTVLFFWISFFLLTVLFVLQWLSLHLEICSYCCLSFCCLFMIFAMGCCFITKESKETWLLGLLVNCQ